MLGDPVLLMAVARQGAAHQGICFSLPALRWRSGPSSACWREGPVGLNPLQAFGRSRGGGARPEQKGTVSMVPWEWP